MTITGQKLRGIFFRTEIFTGGAGGGEEKERGARGEEEGRRGGEEKVGVGGVEGEEKKEGEEEGRGGEEKGEVVDGEREGLLLRRRWSWGRRMRGRKGKERKGKERKERRKEGRKGKKYIFTFPQVKREVFSSLFFANKMAQSKLKAIYLLEIN